MGQQTDQPRGLGWLPDVPKPSDYTDQHPQVAPLLEQTKRAFTRCLATRERHGGCRGDRIAGSDRSRQWFSPIEDQGALGSCTANAAVGLLEYFEGRSQGRYTDASRLFVYKTERNLLGWTGDTGAYLRTAMEALARIMRER